MVPAAEGQPRQDERLLHLSSVPMATTCAMYDGHIIMDPDAEEEALAASTLTLVVNGTGTLIGSLQSRFYQNSASLGVRMQACCMPSTVFATRMLLILPKTANDCLLLHCKLRPPASASSADSKGLSAGLLKAGGTAAADIATLQRCMQAAALRHKELSAVLSQSLQAAGLPSQHR